MTLIDSLGASEGIMTRTETRERRRHRARALQGERARGGREPTTATLVQPGDETIGMLGVGGAIPLGYYKDPEKTAATFRTVGGKRYSIPGDYASIDPDGTIRLLGRGSACINTGGEKVYPEEVELALRAHPDVFDCVVVGVPDEKLGRDGGRTVQPNDGQRRSTPTRCAAHCRGVARRVQGPEADDRARLARTFPGRQGRLQAPARDRRKRGSST